MHTLEIWLHIGSEHSENWPFFYCFLKHESLLFCCCAKSAKSAINEWNKIEFISKKAFRSSKSASFLSEKRDIHVDTASQSLSMF